MNEIVFAFEKHVIPYQISPYKLKLEKKQKEYNITHVVRRGTKTKNNFAD